MPLEAWLFARNQNMMRSAHNKAIKFAPYGRRTLVPRAVYGWRYAASPRWGRSESLSIGIQGQSTLRLLVRRCFEIAH